MCIQEGNIVRNTKYQRQDIKLYNFKKYRSFHGVSIPLPIQIASAEAWSDEKIVEDITKSVGIYYKVKYQYVYWSQLYEKGMIHKPHHHASLDSEMKTDISWVHFLDVPKQKCFRFTDMKGNILIPNEQNSGDIICFPSWVWHEVLPNKTNMKRLVISGNIKITHYFLVLIFHQLTQSNHGSLYLV